MANKQINFIPSDMAVPAKSVKLAKIVDKFSTLGVILLILSIISVVFMFIIFTNEFKNVDNSVKSLTNEISSLEESEQKLILVKDRLEKISYIQTLASAEKDITQFKDLTEKLSFASGSGFTQVDIGSSKTETSLTLNNSNSLASFIDTLSKLEYKKIILSSLGYDLSSGFKTSVIFENK